MNINIETDRFLLRELRIQDASDRYLGWFQDAAAVRYITAAPVTTTLADLRAYIEERAGRCDVLFLGIFDKENGLHVGNIKYEPIDEKACSAVMGVLIGEPTYRGVGVTPEVLTASAAWLKQNRGITRIVLGVDAENTSAIRAYKRVGFEVQEAPDVENPHPDSLTMVWTI